MKILAVIPARGGSKRIKLKNIRDICGKPLIYYQIKNALESNLVSDVVLASDSDDILKVGKDLFGDKIKYIKRPDDIATAYSKTEETLLHVLECLSTKYEMVVTLEPTNPLNTPKHIDKCIMKLQSTNLDAVCCAVQDYSFQLNSIEDYLHVIARPMYEDISPHIKEVGNCWVTFVDALRFTGNRLGENFLKVVIPERDAYHIDTEDDWVVVEALMKQRLMKKAVYYQSRDIPNNGSYTNYWEDVVDPDGKVRDKSNEKEKRIDECTEEINYINSLQPGKILDVGCGLGFFLSAIDERWNKYGVDISEYAQEHAKQYGKVLAGTLQGAKYESDSFDVVVLYHVIEHVKDPIDLLLEIRRVLKPNGRLILGTPDFQCETAKRFGDNFRLLKDKTHISLFGAFDLFRLLTDLMFEVENVTQPFYNTEHFTIKNFRRLHDTSKISPPALGNVITFYARKK